MSNDMLFCIGIIDALLTIPLVAFAVRAFRRGKRERNELRAALDEALTRRPVPVGSGAAMFITGTGAACPICGMLLPCTADFTLVGGLGDHVLAEHPTSSVAADIRRIRATGHTTSLS